MRLDTQRPARLRWAARIATGHGEEVRAEIAAMYPGMEQWLTSVLVASVVASADIASAAAWPGISEEERSAWIAATCDAIDSQAVAQASRASRALEDIRERWPQAAAAIDGIPTRYDMLLSGMIDYTGYTGAPPVILIRDAGKEARYPIPPSPEELGRMLYTLLRAPSKALSSPASSSLDRLRAQVEGL